VDLGRWRGNDPIRKYETEIDIIADDAGDNAIFGSIYLVFSNILVENLRQKADVVDATSAFLTQISMSFSQLTEVFLKAIQTKKATGTKVNKYNELNGEPVWGLLTPMPPNGILAFWPGRFCRKTSPI
jgi:hypothetical protein